MSEQIFSGVIVEAQEFSPYDDESRHLGLKVEYFRPTKNKKLHKTHRRFCLPLIWAAPEQKFKERVDLIGKEFVIVIKNPIN